MPDLPVDDVYGETEGQLAELNPLFAKCFNWEIFRYYYQRAIKAGDDLAGIEKKSGYASYDYNYKFYSHKNTIMPWDPCGLKELNSSSVSFYIPDENWLEQALSLKKEKEELENQGNALKEELDGVNKKMNGILSVLQGNNKD